MTQWLLSAVAVVLLLTSSCFAYLYLNRRRTQADERKSFFTWKFALEPACVIGAALIFSLATMFFCWQMNEDAFMRSFMNAQVLIYLVLLGYIDLKEKIIPNGLIGIGLIFWLVLTLIEIFVAKTPWLPLLKNCLLGGLLVGGVMFVIALIVKSALGMGDVKLFFVLGLLYGTVDTYSILLFSMIIMAVVSLILLALKKVNTKTSIPMAPFVAIGFMLSILAGM